VDPKTQELKKGKPNVVMFVGLQARLSGFGLRAAADNSQY